jgi:hypothetical protein
LINVPEDTETMLADTDTEQKQMFQQIQVSQEIEMAQRSTYSSGCRWLIDSRSSFPQLMQWKCFSNSVDAREAVQQSIRFTLDMVDKCPINTCNRPVEYFFQLVTETVMTIGILSEWTARLRN